MQYLLLIYENEKRFSKGYPEGEMGEYMAFGKEFARRHQGWKRVAAHQHGHHRVRA